MKIIKSEITYLSRRNSRIYVLLKSSAFFENKMSHYSRKRVYFSKLFFYFDSHTQELQNGGSVLRFGSPVFEMYTN